MTYAEALQILEADADNPELKFIDPDTWNEVSEALVVVKKASSRL
jgi:hypothetical protein